MGYVEQIPELKTQSNTNILHLRKTCQASIFRRDAFCISRLFTARRFAYEPRAGTACRSDPAASWQVTSDM